MRCSLRAWSLIGPAICRGNRTIRSHRIQHRSANGPIGKNRSAAFCHSIAAANGNPFCSSRCAARQYLMASGAVPTSASSLRTFPAGLASPLPTNLTDGFTPFTSLSAGIRMISYANAVAWITEPMKIYSHIRCRRTTALAPPSKRDTSSNSAACRGCALDRQGAADHHDHEIKKARAGWHGPSDSVIAQEVPYR